MNYGRRILIFAASVLFLFAVAYGISRQGADSKEALTERVRTEWDARVGGDWGTVYDLTAEKARKTIKRHVFVGRANIIIKEFSIKEVNILEPGKKGLAVIAYTMNHLGFDFKGTSKERWVWENGAWYFDMPSGSPFSKK